MDLHYSQTPGRILLYTLSFTTLWIYTILKPIQKEYTQLAGFTTLWIYTILKRHH